MEFWNLLDEFPTARKLSRSSGRSSGRPSKTARRSSGRSSGRSSETAERSIITWEVAITLPLPGETWEERRKLVFAAYKAAKAEWRSYGGDHLLFVKEVVERVWERLEEEPKDLGFPPFPGKPWEGSEWVEERLPNRRPRYFEIGEAVPDGHSMLFRRSKDGVAWWRDDVVATGVYYALLVWYRQCIENVMEIRQKVRIAAHACGYGHLMP